MMSMHMWESILLNLANQHKCHPPLGKSSKPYSEIGYLDNINPSYINPPDGTCHACLMVSVDSPLNKIYNHTLGKPLDSPVRGFLIGFINWNC